MEKHTAHASILINAPSSKIWDALTNPALIKQCLFGTEAHSDWKKGSPITYTGEWQGKKYEDKGTILEIEKEKLLLCTYWSSFSGLPDAPENYQLVRYELFPKGNSIELRITQENAPTKEAAEHSEKNWGMVLSKLKELVETA